MRIPRWVFRLALGRRLPTTSGVIEVPGVSSTVTIRRDRFGIPYIEAQSDEDAWYGVGFCQGQDRAFQLETLQRAARGTISEIAGVGGVRADRLARQLGFVESARRQMEAVSDDIRAGLEAFACGVTEGVRLGVRRLPHEFILLRTEPTPYSAEDIIAIAKLQGFVLASNWDLELARYHILLADGPEAVAALDPAYPEWHPVSTPPGSPRGPSTDRLAEDLSALREAVGYIGGSNSWALAPFKTSTGRPILSNDPHLRPGLPPHWYLAQVRTPEWAAAGATFVGGPVFPAGHNGTAAWGVTAGLVDTSDLFIEELSDDGLSIREGNDFAPCEVREEVIRVRGAPDVAERVLVTPRGPIVGAATGSSALSLRAKWLDTTPVRGLLTIHRARTFEEFRECCGDWPLSSLNMVYADTSGEVGWQLMGTTPVRKKGWGTVPSLGSDPEAGWEDEHVPHDQMPHASGPSSGVIATANNCPTRDGDGPYLGVDWLDGYRVSRAFGELRRRDNWDVDSTLAFQLDEVSLPWSEMREAVLSTPAHSPDAQVALDLLEAWDGVVCKDSAAATVFELFSVEIARSIAVAKAPNSVDWVVGMSPNPMAAYTPFVARRAGHTSRLVREQPPGWFEEGWHAAIQGALASAVRILRQRYGEDSRAWTWGSVRQLVLKHPVGQRDIFSGIFNRGPFPFGGDVDTVSQAAPAPDDPTGGPLAIASLRIAIDVGEWELSRFSMPGGQSGNPMSPHYDDILPLWLRGEGVPIAWSPKSIEDSAVAKLQLLPRS